MKQGAPIAVREPFETPSPEPSGDVLLLAGATGTAPPLFPAPRLKAKNERLAFVVGAKTKTELLFLDNLNRICTEKSLITTTEDGTYGLQCLVTEPLQSLLAAQRFDMIYTCGPELMISKIFNLAEQRGIPFQASLERLMRCGIGICGSCMIGKYRVCKDGPVFNSNQLSEVKAELGVSKLGFSGDRIPV